MEYELNGNGLRAVVTDHGAELIGFWDADGVQYIWGGDPAFWSGRNPNLFPVVGNLKDETVLVGGAPYHMKRHGFARNKDFSLAEQSAASVTLELTEDGDTLSRYPFPFSFRVTHTLLESGFSTTYTVQNRGGSPMPFCVGGHTAIRCPLREGEQFADYRLVFDEPEDALSPTLTPTGILSAGKKVKLLCGADTLEPDLARFKELDTFMFEGLRSKGVSLLHRDTGRGVRLDFGEFPMVAFWTAPGPFLCLEPWQGCAAYENETGEFRDKPHAVLLPPGAACSRTYSITLV